MPPVQSAPEVVSELLYPAAPITLRNAVAQEQAGTWTKRPLRGFNWWFGDAFLMIFLWLVLAVVTIGVIGVPESDSWLIIVAQLVPWIALAGFPIALTMLVGNGPRIDLGLRFSWRDIGWGLVYGGLSLLVAIVIGVITTQVAGDFNSAAGEVGQELKSNPAVLIVFALLIGIGAPIVEEIAFRGLIFNSLAKFKMWPLMTVFLSAAIFALFHFEGVRIALLFGIGIVLGLARWHTGSTTTAIVAHMCNNIPGALFLLLSS
ncbi:MAG: CPBP family intramembrane metalloprotease [Actinobacteria bacterium]|nr:CPBP family intramembrane metalloprotease [Actinomycetota bacterium]